MLRPAFLPILTLVLATTACQDAVAPEGSPPTPAPSLAGATVSRYVIDDFGRLSEAGSGYSVYVGATPEQLAEFCATGTFEGEPLWEVLDVTRPTGAVHIRKQGRDLPVVVYQAEFYEVCDGTEPVFATGTVDAVGTDNDLLVSGPGANSFGFSGSGIVATPAGERYRLHFTLRIRVLHDGSFKETAKTVLTPIK